MDPNRVFKQGVHRPPALCPKLPIKWFAPASSPEKGQKNGQQNYPHCLVDGNGHAHAPSGRKTGIHGSGDELADVLVWSGSVTRMQGVHQYT